MVSAITTMFVKAACEGWLCVQAGDGAAEVAVSADEPVVAASVIKVLVALEAESAFVDGRLDPIRPILLRARDRTPGPVGFSLFDDDVTISARDLVSAMLTISDNVATDALLGLVGIEACNRLATRLGLTGTVVVSDLATMIGSIARDAGFRDWRGMTQWSAGSPSEQSLVDRRIRDSAALNATAANHTTARDMCSLLRSIWTDRGGPPSACHRVRSHMDRQLTRNRLAAGFPPPMRVAAKSGGLLGVIRNEIGVITQPDGKQFFAAVFTRAHRTATDTAVNAVIGDTAAIAVNALSR